jgi:hypothetical protein
MTDPGHFELWLGVLLGVLLGIALASVAYAVLERYSND